MTTRTVFAKLHRLPLLLLAGCVPLALFVWLGAGGSAEPPPAKPKETAPAPLASLYPKTVPAKNPVELHVEADDRKVFGWVSGTRSFANRPVRITAGGKTHEVRLRQDNTFAWEYRVEKPTTVEVLVDLCYTAVPSPHASLTVRPPAVDPTPSVFFVVDRTAYRPTQPLHFAGFLRKLNADGDFEPLAKTEVEVRLVSEKKQTKAATFKLTSDDFGRIVGSYTFSDADALDHYALSIPGYKGAARVMLGEYRKSKVRLKISGRVVENKLKLKFEPVDFLDQPVPASKCSFSAQVVRNAGRERPATLRAEDFVYHDASTAGWFDPDELPEDELLVWEAEGVVSPAVLWAAGGPPVAAQTTGEVALEGKGPGEYGIDLKREWLEGDYAVVVQGVVTDANGREQRATRRIPIGSLTASALKLELDRPSYLVGEKVTVRARRGGGKGDAREGNIMLVATKLAAAPPALPTFGFANPLVFDARARHRLPGRGSGWQALAPAETVKRVLVTAVPFKGDAATLKLTEPGAYKLIAIATRPDGSTIRSQVGCVVRDPETLPALTLRLDRDEYRVPGKLTGSVHSKFADARVLLTVRDSTGIRLAKPLRLKGGVAALNEALPEGLHYGCNVEVLYFDEKDRVHHAAKFVRVLPEDRILTIKPTVQETVRPGEQVKVEIDVNRREEVDLVVSVYDQSLLGIAPDKSIDVRSFYLADERVRHAADRGLLCRKLGKVSVAELVKKAEALLKEDKELAQRPEGVALSQLVFSVKQRRRVQLNDVAVMLRLAGLEPVLPPTGFFFGEGWAVALGDRDNDRQPLADLIERKGGEWLLVYRFRDNALLLQEWHPSYDPARLQMLQAQNNMLLYPAYYGYMNRGFGMMGINGWGMMGMNGMGMTGMGGMGMMGMSGGMLGGGMGGMPSGNSMHSFLPEGQGFLSHLPPVGALPLVPDAAQAHIGVRRDFSDSAFWNAQVRTDKNGKATVTFKVPDSLTNWQVVVTGVSKKMHVGQAKASFRTFKPVMVWPMLSRTFTEGDRVEVFGLVHNRTDAKQSIRVKLKVENGEVLSPAERVVEVGPKGSAPVYWSFRAGQPGFTQLLMTADCPAGSDASLKRLPVTRAAAEQVVTKSGMVKDGATLGVPEGIDLKAATLEVTFAPSLAADMADTLNFLVEYPYGCVEQTMSRFLPAIKVAQVLQQFHVEHPELQKKLPGCVAGGIKRLLELQLPDGGWGWHGGGQTHEMMTPYALYGLLQAEKAGYKIPADQAVERGLNRLKMFIDQMGEAQAADRIYCIHVYAHRRNVEDKWWEFIAEQLQRERLSDYALALALETAVQKGKTDLAGRLANALRARAQKAGGHVYWRTAGFSRWGDNTFEVTAAAMKALVAYDKDDPLVDGVLRFFAVTKRGDRWNSTKDTAMIVYAICDYLAKENFNPQASNALKFSINGGDARAVTFDDKLTKKVVMPADVLKAGENKLTFKTEMTGVMYRLTLRYWKTGRDIAPMDRGISVRRNFYLLDGKGGVVKQLRSGDSVPRGSYVLSEVVGKYALPDGMRYVLVENPKPAGAEILPPDDPRFVQNQHCTAYALREERSASVAFHHEQTPQALNDRCVLLAELAGDYVIAPAFVELMYQTETRGHSGTFVLKVVDEKK